MIKPKRLINFIVIGFILTIEFLRAHMLVFLIGSTLIVIGADIPLSEAKREKEKRDVVDCVTGIKEIPVIHDSIRLDSCIERPKETDPFIDTFIYRDNNWFHLTYKIRVINLVDYFVRDSIKKNVGQDSSLSIAKRKYNIIMINPDSIK